MTAQDEITRYLKTGQSDPVAQAWPDDGGIWERICRADRELRGALIEKVKHLASGRTRDVELDVTALTRKKTEPMVRSLFPPAEWQIVQQTVDESVVFVTTDRVDSILRECSGLSTAWDLANLYLLTIGVESLAPDAPQIVGLSKETTCYVSPSYVSDNEPFSDFVVHEVAHIFHNCRRCTVGLPETGNRRCLLDIRFDQTETFAYVCEAYSWILEHATSPKERRMLSREFTGLGQQDTRVDPMRVAEIVQVACGRRNGWESIYNACTP